MRRHCRELIEDLRGITALVPGVTPGARVIDEDVVVFDIQTVCDYVMATDGNRAPVDDLPCVTPPWEFCALTGVVYGDPCLWRVDDDGGMFYISLFMHDPRFGSPQMQANCFVEVDDTGRPTNVRYQTNQSLGNIDVDGMFDAPLEALAMCHIKGAEITDPRPLKKPGALLGASTKPLQTFRTLRIEPLERFVRDVALARRSGSAKRAHLVRGHYKDFREKGVAGNPNARGIYWTPAHIRGVKSKGIIAKEYESGGVGSDE